MNHFERLYELLELLVNDSITTSQHKELQEILLGNSDAQDAYLAFIDLHFGLHHLTGSEWVNATFAERKATIEYRSPLQRKPFSLKQTAVLLASLAAVVLFLWPTLFRSPTREEVADRSATDRSATDRSAMDPRATGPVNPLTEHRTSVKLVQAAGADLFGERLPLVGTALEFDREYAVTSGMLKLRFPEGAEVILDAPCVIEIADHDRLLLRVGNCSVYAPPGAEGFRVDTPRSEIIDRGTRFSVSVNEVGETDVQVIEGLAEIRGTSPAAHDPIELTQQQARRFGGNAGEMPEPLPFSSEHYRSGLPDRVVGYKALANADGEVSELLNVTVQRGGVARRYSVADLIGVRVSHFHGGRNRSNIVVASGYQGEIASVLESDSLLQTGMINPGGAIKPLRKDPVFASTDDGKNEPTPGMAIRFRRPVVNGPGPDVVFFELQTVTNPPEGDAFHVSPLKFDPGLHSVTVRNYDISMSSRDAKRLVQFDQFVREKPVRSLAALLHDDAIRRKQVLGYYAIAVGIDLSDLGYTAGAEVDGLFFQDALDDKHTVDPVFIAGLPSNQDREEKGKP